MNQIAGSVAGPPVPAPNPSAEERESLELIARKKTALALRKLNQSMRFKEVISRWKEEGEVHMQKWRRERQNISRARNAMLDSRLSSLSYLMSPLFREAGYGGHGAGLRRANQSLDSYLPMKLLRVMNTSDVAARGGSGEGGGRGGGGDTADTADTGDW